MTRVVVLFVLSVFAGAAPAYAYLDPGTGSLLLQGLVAAVAAGMGAMTIMWHRIKTILGFESGTPASKAGEEDRA